METREETNMTRTRRAAFRIALSIAGAALLPAGLPSVAAAAQAVDHLGVPGPIRFDGKSFVLAWSAQPSAGYVKQEYVPAGQAVERYEQMLLLERVPGKLKAIDAANMQVQALKQRKASDPIVNMDLVQNPKSGEVLLDFVVSAKDRAGHVIVEWNAYRYATIAGGEPGVMLFGVSHRAYGAENAKAFMGRLKTLRAAQMNALAKADMPRLR
ncbi:hypothetical protein [Pseudorhodoferax sp.]|uniref:hypothetical protein n=1 Tax=Pseudorhodoferax sp. TaxID=1993553 RepID=UPI0039E5F881